MADASEAIEGKDREAFEGPPAEVGIVCDCMMCVVQKESGSSCDLIEKPNNQITTASTFYSHADRSRGHVKKQQTSSSCVPVPIT